MTRLDDCHDTWRHIPVQIQADISGHTLTTDIQKRKPLRTVILTELLISLHHKPVTVPVLRRRMKRLIEKPLLFRIHLEINRKQLFRPDLRRNYRTMRKHMISAEAAFHTADKIILLRRVVAINETIDILIPEILITVLDHTAVKPTAWIIQRVLKNLIKRKITVKNILLSKCQ